MSDVFSRLLDASIAYLLRRLEQFRSDVIDQADTESAVRRLIERVVPNTPQPGTIQSAAEHLGAARTEFAAITASLNEPDPVVAARIASEHLLRALAELDATCRALGLAGLDLATLLRHEFTTIVASSSGLVETLDLPLVPAIELSDDGTLSIAFDSVNSGTANVGLGGLVGATIGRRLLSIDLPLRPAGEPGFRLVLHNVAARPDIGPLRQLVSGPGVSVMKLDVLVRPWGRRVARDRREWHRWRHSASTHPWARSWPVRHRRTGRRTSCDRRRGRDRCCWPRCGAPWPGW